MSHSIALLFPIPGHAGSDKALRVFVHVHRACLPVCGAHCLNVFVERLTVCLTKRRHSCLHSVCKCLHMAFGMLRLKTIHDIMCTFVYINLSYTMEELATFKNKCQVRKNMEQRRNTSCLNFHKPCQPCSTYEGVLELAVDSGVCLFNLRTGSDSTYVQAISLEHASRPCKQTVQCN